MTNSLRRIPASTYLAGMILLGFALRLGSIDFQSLWRDEVDAIRFGSDLANRIAAAVGGSGLGGVVDQIRLTLTQPGFNGPLYFIGLHAWSRVAGETAYALRLLSSLFGVLALPLIYVLARRMFRYTALADRAPRLGLLTAWLAAVSPYFIWYSQEAKMYTEITALALTAIYALRRAVDAQPGARAWPWWLLAVAATTMAMYSHILAALLLGVEVILFLTWWPQARQHWRGGAIGLAALTLPYLPLIGWQLDLALTPGSQGFAFFRFDEIVRVMINAFTHGVLPLDHSLGTIGVRWDAAAVSPALNPVNWSVWIAGVLIILGALMWRDSTDRIRRLGLVAWAIAPPLAVAIISVNRPIFTDRYLIWIGPAVYLLAALGILDVWRWRRVAGGAALALVTLTALVSAHAQAITPFKSDFRSAARYVEERFRGETIVFQIPYGRYTFDYYFRPQFAFLDGPYTNFRFPDGSYQRDAAMIESEIASLLRGQAAVWLVATEVEMWDDRGLLEAWLNGNGRLTDSGEFMRVTARRYQFAP